MRLNRKEESGIVLTVVLLVVVVTTVVGISVFRSNKNSTNTTATQETNLNIPTKNAEIKKEAEDVTKGTIIKSGDSKFGSMLFDGQGQAIYIWELEDSTTPECYGNCAEAWPPVLTNGTPVASDGVTSELLGTTKRTDGGTQVTYNGHPLYYYAHEKPGEVKCHNISTHGGLWWVIQPNGIRAG